MDRSHIPSSAAFRALSQHVEALQRRVRVLEERVGVESDAADAAADAESSTAGRDQDRTQNRDRERDQALDPRSNAASPPRGARAPYTGLSSRRHGPDDEVLFELEDLHQHNRINRLNTLARPREREHIDGGEPRHREYGYRDGSDRGHSLAPDPKVSVRLSRGRMIADGVAVPPRVNYVGAPHPFAFLLPAGTDYIAAALAHLPDQAQCERLVQVFFDKIEWFQRSLHYSTFMDQCRLFWAGTTTTQTLSPDFVVIYVMVICLALTRTAAGSPDVQGTLALADRLYHIAEVSYKATNIYT
jgi:hypothetical protein